VENKLPVRSDLNIAILVLFAQARSFGATQITDVMVVNGLIKVSSGLWIALCYCLKPARFVSIVFSRFARIFGKLASYLVV